MENISDEMIARAAQGDQAAFEAVYRSFSKFVYNVAWRIVHAHEDAEEVTQEVFLTIYRKLSSFKFQSTLKTWIYRVTINAALNYSKKLSKTKNKTTEYNEQIHCAGILGEAQVRADKEHNEKLVEELLKTLTPDQRACIVLRNIEGLSYQEIAEALGLNINTVRSRLSRGREALLQLRKEVIKNEV
jgi:RNA polymerase sigma-70 factor (ECF subfamily)